MFENAPLITVIIATFNAASTLPQCIDSFVRQSYPRKELVVMDGGSTDGTVEVLKANDDPIAYWESEPDRGIFHAWNKALDRATGEWLYFLGADDYFWEDDVLERLVPYLSESSSRGIRVVYGRVAWVEPGFRSGDAVNAWAEPWEKAGKWFRQDMSIPHQGTMHHRTLFEEHGRFDESFLTAGDYDLLLRELKSREALFVPGMVVAGMRTGGISTNRSNRLLSVLEAARARRNNGIKGFSPALFSRGFYAFRGLARSRLSDFIGAERTDWLVERYKALRGGTGRRIW